MPGRFDQRLFDQLRDYAEMRIDPALDMVRSILYEDGMDSAPAGHDNLDTPEKVGIFTSFVGRQANREQHDMVPGDLNQAMADHPAFQQMAADAQGASKPPSPQDQGVL